METPWGQATTILYANSGRDVAFVWARYGKGLMFTSQPVDRNDRERAFAWRDKWWVPGVTEK